MRDELPALPSARNLLGHPPGLFLLFLVEMWERFSYYGMRALLVIYLIHDSTGDNPGRGWSKVEASHLYGWYTGLVYLTPLCGGLIADRLTGTHRSLVVGSLIITLGHLTLFLSGIGDLAHHAAGQTLFVSGLVLIVMGTGHFKPAVPVMVGQLYPPSDPRRDGAYTIFYMGVNLGAFLSAFVCGTLGEKIGWHWGFGAAALGMVVGLVLYLLGRPRFLGQIGAPPRNGPDRSPLFLVGAVVVAGGVGALFHAGAFAWLQHAIDAMSTAGGVLLPLTLVALVLGWSTWFVARLAPAERGPTVVILILICFNAAFWLAAEQSGSSLNIFAVENTERRLAGWEIPATWFQSVNPLAIILLGPLFAGLWSWLGRRKHNPTQPMKIVFALVLIGVAYLFMVAGSLQVIAGAKAGMGWLLATYLLLTWGELCLSPTGLAFVTSTAPTRHVSFLMGIWFLANMVANIIGGLVAAKVEGIEQGQIDLFWYPWFRLGGQADFFLLFVILSFAGGALILLLTPVLSRLLTGKGRCDANSAATTQQHSAKP